MFAPGSIVAVTGANGFIASHVCKQLLEGGYVVRAIVRNHKDAEKVAHIVKMADECKGKLELFSGDLLQEGSYDAAFQGADAVIHTATVVLLQSSNPMKEIVEPSIQGTKNVLSSADKAKTVKRFVHTSSIASVLRMDKNEDDSHVFTEDDYNTWGKPENGDYYGFGKHAAEVLVREHCKEAGATFDCVFINPGVVLGPCLTKAHTKASAVVVRQCLYGNEQANYHATFVDVREVARAHVAAMERKEAAGKRFIITNDRDDGNLWISELGARIQPLFPNYKIDSAVIPWWKIMLARLLFRLSEYEIAGMSRRVLLSNARSKTDLGLVYRPLADCLRDTVVSMVDNGWIKPRNA